MAEQARETAGEVTRAVPMRHSGRSSTSPAVTSARQWDPPALTSAGELLDKATLDAFETALGHDFSRVRLHADNRAAVITGTVGAGALAIGRDLVLGPAMARSDDVRRHAVLAHELTHVAQFERSGATGARGFAPADSAAEREALQQVALNPVTDEATARRHGASITAPPHAVMTDRSTPASPPTEPDYAWLAFEVFDAMEGLGTDEERVYRALEQLRKDDDRIRKFRAAYGRHGDLDADIEDDFSGSEKEYALQLLNMGRRGAMQVVVRGRATAAQMPQLVKRVRSAFFDELGTDEEAVFAQLVRLDHDVDLIALFEAEYARQSQGVSFRVDLEDEMSEDEEEYQHALYLLSAPYEHWLRRANAKLRGLSFGIPWGAWCGAEPKGSKYPDAYDTRYWEEADDVRDGIIQGCKLLLRKGVRPSTAVAAMIDEQEKWAIDCAGFVQVAHWYAMLHTVGPNRFDAQVGRPFELKKARSTGVRTRTTFKAHRPGERMQVHVIENGSPVQDMSAEPVDPGVALHRAPVGSRVMWTNIIFTERPRLGDERIENAREFENENTIKLGDNQYGAFPLRSGGRTVMQREEIEKRMAEVAADAFGESVSVIRPMIFISEIELIEPATGTGPLP